MTDTRPAPALGDPADRQQPTPDAGVDQFQGTHRGGYGSSLTRLERALYWARKGSSLRPEEGELLAAEIDRLRARIQELEAGNP